MNLKALYERLGPNREQVIRETLSCQSAEELLALAAEKGIELTEQEAEKILPFLRFKPAEPLSESELEVVTGGDEDKNWVWPCLLCGNDALRHKGGWLWYCEACNQWISFAPPWA